jgi:hypothetical protein
MKMMVLLEHVIRDEKDLDEICTYIEGNPACWETDDPLHPNMYRDTIVSRY